MFEQASVPLITYKLETAGLEPLTTTMDRHTWLYMFYILLSNKFLDLEVTLM